MKGFPSRWLLRFVGIALFGVIVFRYDSLKVIGNLGLLDLWEIALLVLMTMVFLLLKNIRWYLLLSGSGGRVSFKNSFLYYMAGMYLGLVTPGRIGDLSKVYFLKAKEGMSVVSGIVITVFDRMMDLIVMAGVSFLFVVFRFSNAGRNLIFVSGIIVVVVSFLIMGVASKCACSIARRLAGRFFKGFGNKDLVSTDSLCIVRVDFTWLTAISVTWGAMLLLMYQSFMIGKFLGMGISFFKMGGALVTANMVSLLPITILGIGTREAVLLATVGSHLQDKIVSVGILFLLVNNMFCVVVGFLSWMLLGNLQKKE